MQIEKNGKSMITLEEFNQFVLLGGIVDGTKGGLLIGNSHLDGGIYVIRQYKNEQLYEFIAELEGWEYIICPQATLNYKVYLETINAKYSGSKEIFKEYEIPENITVIDTSPIISGIKELNKIVFFGECTQYIVNKHSTKKYLIELNNINNEYGS